MDLKIPIKLVGKVTSEFEDKYERYSLMLFSISEKRTVKDSTCSASSSAIATEARAAILRMLAFIFGCVSLVGIE